MEEQVVDLATKDSTTSIASHIKKLDIEEQENIQEKVDNNELMETTGSSLNSSSESSSSSSSTVQEEIPQKRKRKRKRRPRKKAINAYIPDEPFVKRYKTTFVELSVMPKIHIKFDEQSGNVLSYQNNYKPRIIKALSKNLSLAENLKVDKIIELNEEKATTEICEEAASQSQKIISLKPRVIKAIGT